MLTTSMKYVAIVALIMSAVLWSYASSYHLAVRFVVGVGAFLVAVQAMRAAKYAWATGFCTIALLFNPILPIGAARGELARVVVVATAVLFAISVSALQARPLLSIPSIIGRNPESQSL